jgi:threonyl-tRNA synthetase
MAIRRELYDPQGNRVWDEDSQPVQAALELVEGRPGGAVVHELLGHESARGCAPAEILATIERLEFVSRAGCAPGFAVVLPKGVVFEQALETLDRAHARSLDATRMELPLVFERSGAELVDLTASFESQGRMFRFEGRDRDLRLAYAADPMLFGLLRGRRLDASRLPYVVYTPLPVFKRWQTGELGLTTMRQYTLPDIHALCVPADALATYGAFLERAASSARFLFEEEWAQFLEVSPELGARFPALGSTLAAAAGRYTLVRRVERRTRYFDLKGGIDVHIGAGTVMLFNFQWDETSSERFDFRTEEGEPLAVVHSTLIGGWTKVLSAIVGQALSKQRPRTIPVELAPVQVAVVPVGAEHREAAERVAAELRERGLRVAGLAPSSKSLGARIKLLREAWNPFHAVVGDREAEGMPVVLRRPIGEGQWSVDELLAEFGARIDACRPADGDMRVDLPFA